MRRIIIAGLVALLPAIAPAVALARAPMETNQLVDGNGNPIGTPDNPLVVTGGAGGGGGGSTGSVTPAGTNGTAAQAVQGINGGVPVGVLAASLPLPAGASTEATQQGVATSNAAINTATGTQADAATASGANTSIIGALRAIRDRLLGTVSIAQTATSSIGVQRTTGIGTTGVQVSASDATNRRTVTNTSNLACELMGSAAAYGTGYPLPAGGSFTFDASGRTTAALFVACSASGGTVAVLSY